MPQFWLTVTLLSLLLLPPSLLLMCSKIWRRTAKWAAFASAIGVIVGSGQATQLNSAMANFGLTLTLLFIFFLVSSLIALAFKSMRSKAKWAAPACAIGLVASVGLLAWAEADAEKNARAAGFPNAAASRAAEKAKTDAALAAVERRAADEDRAVALKRAEEEKEAAAQRGAETRRVAEQKAAEDTARRPGDVRQAAPPATPPTIVLNQPRDDNKCTVSKTQFLALQAGMSYRQAVRALGCLGDELSRSEMLGTVTVMYSWKGSVWSGANMNAMFRMTGSFRNPSSG
jgi:hypothetical protein